MVGAIPTYPGEDRRQDPLHLASETGSIAKARRFVCDLLGRWGAGGTTADVAALVTSEVVSNAIVHAGGPVTVRVGGDAERVVVRVQDRSAELPTVRAADARRIGGQGMRIVDALATAWGVDILAGGGKIVWFELGLAGPSGHHGVTRS